MYYNVLMFIKFYIYIKNVISLLQIQYPIFFCVRIFFLRTFLEWDCELFFNHNSQIILYSKKEIEQKQDCKRNCSIVASYNLGLAGKIEQI